VVVSAADQPLILTMNKEHNGRPVNWSPLNTSLSMSVSGTPLSLSPLKKQQTVVRGSAESLVGQVKCTEPHTWRP
jgi:hypothetical protein